MRSRFLLDSVREDPQAGTRWDSAGTGVRLGQRDCVFRRLVGSLEWTNRVVGAEQKQYLISTYGVGDGGKGLRV